MRRVVFYLFYDADGIVDDYVLYKLERLREYAEHIFVVSNSPIAAAGRARLEKVADTVWERENTGFDVWAYKTALERFGWERLREYDELIFMNYTFFAPVHPFSELFAKADSWDTDFWGITEHAEVRPHPHLPKRSMPAHIQSHWIAVRKSLFATEDFYRYWQEMPPVNSYEDSISVHESVFTKHFADLGYRYEIAYPRANYPADHPVFDNADQLVADGCPIVKRRVFFHDPLYLDQRAIIGRDLTDNMEKAGYPMDLLWANLARTAVPRVVATNAALTEVLPFTPDPVALGAENLQAAKNFKVAVVAHVFYEDMIEEIMGLANNLPGGYDLYVSTFNAEKKAYIEEYIAKNGGPKYSEVRIVGSNRGRDISAFLITMADVLEVGRYDIVVKLHSKRSPQEYNLATLFKRHLFENILGSPGYGANMLALFAKHPNLGMVFPPVIHMGYGTLGRAWYHNKKPAGKVMARLGIKVPLDDTTPLSPYGSMFVARPQALQKLLHAFTWEDFPDEGGYSDGSLAHVIERVFSYASLGEGLHVRTILNTRWAGIYYSDIEYKYQAVSEYMPPFAIDQIPYLQALSGVRNLVGKRVRLGDLLAIGKGKMVMNHPRLSKALKPVYKTARAVYRRLRRRGR